MQLVTLSISPVWTGSRSSETAQEWVTGCECPSVHLAPAWWGALRDQDMSLFTRGFPQVVPGSEEALRKRLWDGQHRNPANRQEGA